MWKKIKKIWSVTTSFSLFLEDVLSQTIRDAVRPANMSQTCATCDFSRMHRRLFWSHVALIIPITKRRGVRVEDAGALCQTALTSSFVPLPWMWLL